MKNYSRRTFIKSSLTAGAAALTFPRCVFKSFKWKFSVITSEISQDLDHALSVMQEFGMDHAELRDAWGTNIANWDESLTLKVKESLFSRGFKASCLASPIYKCELPPAGEDDMMWKREQGYLHNLIRIAHSLDCKLIRIFGFRPVPDLKEDYSRILDYIGRAVEMAAEAGCTIVFENVGKSNFCTTESTLPLFKDITSAHFGWLYDPGNCKSCGGRTFPEEYAKIPKDRIKHVHLKDVVFDEKGSRVWMPIGEGLLDIKGICDALKNDGYQGFLSLETHYVPEGGTKEDGTRASWAGLKRILT